MKNLLRRLLQTLHCDVTENMRQDRLTLRVIDRVVGPGKACIDIGCHRGGILDRILGRNPDGPHWAFEPIPSLCEALRTKYGRAVTVSSFALSDASRRVPFHFVKNAPGYSGLRSREYPVARPVVEVLEVETRRLDELIPADVPIAFIKIDVEGAELPVLNGARSLLERCRPVVLFECGLGASEYYGTTPEAVGGLLEACGLAVWLPEAWLAGDPPLNPSAFRACFLRRAAYNFLAAPPGARP